MIIEYSQRNNEGYFSCFKNVKYDQDGAKVDMAFVRNDIECMQLTKEGGTYFLVFFNNETSSILDLKKLENFGLESLEIKLNLKFQIDPKNTIVYIALPNITIIDAAPLVAISEINKSAIKQKYYLIVVVALI